jgi:hypothetical protein
MPDLGTRSNRAITVGGMAPKNRKSRQARIEAAREKVAARDRDTATTHAAPEPAEPPPPSPLAERAAWIGFWTTLALAWIWVIGHATMVDAVTVALCDQADAGITNRDERPPLFLAPMAFDGYVWNRHAEYLGRNGELRLRQTDFDNAPHGREVHWNSAFAWYLRGLGEIYRAATGESLQNAISRMSIWANPILLTFTLAIFGTIAAERFGPLCGVVVLIGMVTTPSFYEGFLPAYPDHHGIIAFTLLGLAFGLAWAGGGWLQPEDGTGFIPPRSMRQAKEGIVLSALSGAAGLWISALSTTIIMGAAGAGTLVATFLMAKRATASGCTFHPELIRLWAKVGAGAAFILYLAEYFPWHLGMRLEVNHPLYAIAWLGGGWILADACLWLALPEGKRPAFPWKRLLLPAAACAMLPATILIGGAAVYIPSDPFMSRLWHSIVELLPLLLRIKLGDLTWLGALGFYPLLVVLGVAIVSLRRLDGGTKLIIVQLIVPILLITALQFYQSRWGMLTGPLYIALAGVVVPVEWRVARRSGVAKPLVAMVLVGYALIISFPAFTGWLMPAYSQFRTLPKVEINPQQAMHLLHRDMAKAIRANAAGKPVVLLSSPNSSCILASVGDFKTVGTLYWENVDGLKAAAHALNAQSDDEAFAELQRLGITHVSLMTWENFIGPYFSILYPTPVAGKSLDRSFGQAALFANRLPVWARPIPFKPHPLAKALNQKILLLEIVPNQSRAEACRHVSRYLRISQQDLSVAENFAREAIAIDPDNPATRIELAAVCLTRGAVLAAAGKFDEARSAAAAAVASLAATESDEAKAMATRAREIEEAYGRGEVWKDAR